MAWPILALACSFVLAMYIWLNQHFRISGIRLVFLRALWVVVGLGAVLAASGIAMPGGVGFLVFSLLTGAFVLVADTFLFNASAKHGARLTSLFLPLKMMLAFVLWNAVDTSSFQALLGHPAVFAGVLLCFALTTYALFYLRKNDASWAALLAVVPVAGLLSFCDIFSKSAMELAAADVLSAILWHIWLCNTVMLVGGAVYTFAYRKHAPAQVFTPANLWQAGAVTLAYIGILATVLPAMLYASNPAYVTCITVLSSVWLMLHARFVGREQVRWAPSLMLIGSAAALVFITRFL